MKHLSLFALLLLAAAPARAGVAVSAEAGAEGVVPRVSLQTSLSPAPGLVQPSLAGGLALAPVLAAASAPQLTALQLPATVVPTALGKAVPSAAKASLPADVNAKSAAVVPSALEPVLSVAAVEDQRDGKVEDAGKALFDGSSEKAAGGFPALSFAEADTSIEPGGLRGFFRRLGKSVGVGRPLLRAQFDDNSRAHYYHGVSLGVLEKAIDEDGGKLKSGLTFLSDEAGHPYGYARTSMRRTGTAGTVLQFEPLLIEPLIKPGHYNPRAPERGEKWEDVPHWFQAVQDIPLSAQTALSKKTVLDYLADERDAHPNDPAWAERVVKFEAAFGVKARAPKPAVDPAETVEGRLGIEGIAVKGGRWTVGGKVLQRLGRGTIGFVDVHPTRPGLVLKTLDPTIDQFLFAGLDMKTAIEADEKAAKTLAAAGVGPAFIGAMTFQKRRVSVRERVFGKTMADIVSEKKFGPAEEALVLDMVQRMAEKSVLVSDMKPENIMIGTTERDPVRKAWFIDGGMVEEMPPSLTVEQRVDKILDYGNVIAIRQDFNARQVVESIRTLRWYIAEGREDSSLSRWRLFLKKLGAAIVMGGAAAANK